MYVVQSPKSLIRKLLSKRIEKEKCVKASKHAKNMFFDPKMYFFTQISDMYALTSFEFGFRKSKISGNDKKKKKKKICVRQNHVLVEFFWTTGFYYKVVVMLKACRTCLNNLAADICKLAANFDNLAVSGNLLHVYMLEQFSCKYLEARSILVQSYYKLGRKLQRGNRNKLQNASQLCLGYSPLTSAIMVSPNIMNMRDFVLWIARRRITCL